MSVLLGLTGPTRFSFGSGEWREAAVSQLKFKQSWVQQLLSFFLPVCWLEMTKEAEEVMGDSSGRWYTFAPSLDTLVCLEKAGLPDHLQQLPSIENPVTLRSLLAEMEDSGEASVSLGRELHPNVFFRFPRTLSQCSNYMSQLPPR